MDRARPPWKDPRVVQRRQEAIGAELPTGTPPGGRLQGCGLRDKPAARRRAGEQRRAALRGLGRGAGKSPGPGAAPGTPRAGSACDRDSAEAAKQKAAQRSPAALGLAWRPRTPAASRSPSSVPTDPKHPGRGGRGGRPLIPAFPPSPAPHPKAGAPGGWSQGEVVKEGARVKCKHEAGWALWGSRLGVQKSVVAFTTAGSGKLPLPTLIPVTEVKIILPTSYPMVGRFE